METGLNQSKRIFFYNFPILGETAIAQDDKGICAVFALKKQTPDSFNPREFITCETPLIKNAAKQIDEYFGQKRRDFDISLSLSGTEFEQKVHKALMSIPFGKTVSYKELAALADRPSAVRAAGTACGKNKLLILVPCHRCIAADGGLAGFAAGIETKRQLLSLEGKIL